MVFVEPGDITELIETGQFEEGVELEAKRAGGGIPRNAWESVCAFANTLGGVLVLGLDEVEDGWRVGGVSDPDKMVQDIHNAMRDRGKISHEASGNGDVWKEEVEGRQLVIARVRAASRRHKPVFLNGNRDIAYVRRNEGDARCTQDELDRMRREATPSSFDAQVIPFLELADFDHDAIGRYRAMSADVRPHLAHHRLDTEAFLRSTGAWRIDRDRGVKGPTVGGILMFGTESAIREIRSDHLIDYRRIPVDSTPSRRWTDRVQWTGNLFGAWERIFPLLTRGLPTPFRLRGPQRVDQPAGLEALREAFVNLLVHTDYQESSDAVILHRDDGYTFRNPGDSWVDLRDIGVDGRSDRRNPEIAKLFDHVGLADRAGSGFLRILDEWRELGYQNPNITSDPTRYEFELELKLAALLSAEDRRWLGVAGGPWKEEEELALIFALRSGYVDNQSLRLASGQHLFDASQTLRSLRDRGLLTLQGAGRNSSYVLGPAAINHTDHLVDSTDHSPAEGDRLPDEGNRLGPEGAHLDAEGKHLAPEGAHLDAEGKHLGPSPEYVHKETLLQIVVTLRSTRKAPSSKAMRDTILKLCAVEPLSTKQLGELLRRSQLTIRRYVQELEHEGRLAKADPLPGIRFARYITVSLSTERQKRLELLD